MALLPGPGARAAPPRPGWGLRPPDEGAEGEAERVGRKRATPSKTDGLVGQTVALPALPLGAEVSADLNFPTRSSSSRSFPLQEAQAQAPPSVRPGLRESPPRLCGSQSEPAHGSPFSPPPGRSLSALAPPTASRSFACGRGLASLKGIVSLGGEHRCSACGPSPPAQTAHRRSRVSACLYFWVPPLFPDPTQRFPVAVFAHSSFKIIWSHTDTRAYTHKTHIQPINNVNEISEREKPPTIPLL